MVTALIAAEFGYGGGAGQRSAETGKEPDQHVCSLYRIWGRGKKAKRKPRLTRATRGWAKKGQGDLPRKVKKKQ